MLTILNLFSNISRNTRRCLQFLSRSASRSVREAYWIFFFALTFWISLALSTWNARDPGFSNSVQTNIVYNSCGVLGAYLSDLLFYFFGYSTWWCVAAIVCCLFNNYSSLINGLSLSTHIGMRPSPNTNCEKFTGFVFLFIGSLGIEASVFYSYGMHLPGNNENNSGAGGIIGQMIVAWIRTNLGSTGNSIIPLILFLIGLSFLFALSWLTCIEFARRQVKFFLFRILEFYRVSVYLKEKKHRRETVNKIKAIQETKLPDRELTFAEKDVSCITGLNSSEKKNELVRLSPIEAKGLLETELLSKRLPVKKAIPEKTTSSISRLIEKNLANFGVIVKVISAHIGPVVTRYELQPATGVKGSQIVSLVKDLARSLALSTSSIHIVEVIPGKNLMGLELPNPHREVVRLTEIIASKTYLTSSYVLPIILGKDILGEPVLVDLAQMPHLLIAGTTGSGKSVGIHAIILSLLRKNSADKIRLVLVDPKMLEMSIYEGMPHLLVPVITDLTRTSSILEWCVKEMERRYQLMSEVGVRNLFSYNEKIREASTKKGICLKSFENDPYRLGQDWNMPFIIVVIDELADLMLTSGKKIENIIIRLTQKARAAGIHLILATQRPSVDVITGLIKANVPARIAFQVSSKIDSRTILDKTGAETLLGKGDMLYLKPGMDLPIRVHGAFVNDSEIRCIVEKLKSNSYTT